MPNGFPEDALRKADSELVAHPPSPSKTKKPATEAPKAPPSTSPSNKSFAYRGMDEEELWTQYAIRRQWPTQEKVYLLWDLWKLSALSIAEVLGITEADAEKHIETLKAEITALGSTLTPEDQVYERGRMIKQLERALLQCESQYTASRDPKILQQKSQILEKILKLRGLDQNKINSDTEKDGVSFEDKVNSMTAEKKAELANRLKEARPNPTE